MLWITELGSEVGESACNMKDRKENAFGVMILLLKGVQADYLPGLEKSRCLF